MKHLYNLIFNSYGRNYITPFIISSICCLFPFWGQAQVDLALIKQLNTTISTDPGFNPGSDVTFTILVLNQGGVDALNVEVTDYLPATLTNPSLSAPATTNGGTPINVVDELVANNRFTIDILPSNDTVEVNLTVTIAMSFTGLAITNYAEISAAATLSGPATDTDSSFDSMNGNSPGELGNVLVDNAVDEDGMNGGDEDDHDLEIITICQTELYSVCDNGSTSLTLTADAGLNNIIWYNESDVQIGVGSSITVDANTQGLDDGMESFYYTAISADGCSGLLCCPITITTEPCDMSIGSTVFADLDDDGNFNNSDTTISGVILALYEDVDMDGVPDGDAIALDTTDADGNYLFDNLMEGSYIVGIATPPADLTLSSTTTNNMDDGTDNDDNGIQDNAGDPVLSPTITLEEGTEPDEPNANEGADQDDANEDNGDMTVDFGFTPAVSIGSTVFVDLDNDGIHEIGDGENGIPGVPVILYDDTQTPIDTVITDSNGDYFFGGLPQGTYYVGISPDGFGSGESLEQYPLSSTDIATSTADNNTDEDDNGLQPGGAGTAVLSPAIVLTGNGEPTGSQENGSGGTQDDLDDDNGDMTVDFGFVPLMSIGSTVFVDANDDGMFDEATESGLENVELSLYTPGPDGIPNTSDDVLIDTETTDMMGDYLFDSIPPGDYFIVINTPPTEYDLSSTPTNTNDDQMDNDDNGSQDSAGDPISSPIITLSPGMEPVDESGQGGDQDGQLSNGDLNDDNGDMTIDFGLIPSVSIGSTVFADLDNDGLFNNADTTISNVIIELYADEDMDGVPDGPAIATDTTDADGNYFFGGLPEGTYIVGVPTPPTGLSLSSTDIATSTSDNTTDNDDNGIQSEAGDPVYSPSITLTAGSEVTEPNSNEGADQDDANDDNGNMTVDFGFTPAVSIGSTVFADIDNDALYEPEDGENGIPGVPVILYDDTQTPIDTVITDSNGDYFFGGLPQGTYYVGISADAFGTGEPMAAFPQSSTDIASSTADNQTEDDDNGLQPGGTGTAVLSPAIVLTDGSEPTGSSEDGSGGTQDDIEDDNGDMTVDFGFIPLMSIGSTVFTDYNNDGMFDEASESGVEDVTVRLYQPGPDGIVGTADDILIDEVMTDMDGNYLFDTLAPANYYVVVFPPDSLNLSSTPTNTADDQMDNDDNGSQVAAGDSIISPIIMLTPGNEPVNEPGQGGDQDGQLASGDPLDQNGDMTIDFGLLPSVSLGSTVFVDANNDGFFDETTEEGIEGVLLQLFSVGADGIPNTSDDMLIANDVTDSNGDYFFGGLTPGDYYISIPVVPSEYPLSSLPTDTDDNTDDNDDNGIQDASGNEVLSPVITLTPNGEATNETGQGGNQDLPNDDDGNMTVDFGFLPAVSIGSTVFADIDNDGLFEPADGENGIAGVPVELYSPGPDGMIGGGDDVLISSTTTDDDGDYFFGGLPEGNYYVQIPMAAFDMDAALEGLQQSSDPTDTNDNNEDNDDNGSQLGGQGTVTTSPIIELLSNNEPENESGQGGEQDDADDNNGDMTVDFGFIPQLSIGSTVFADDNNDGQFDELNESGLPNVDLELYNVGPDGILGTADDFLVATTSTDMNGDYIFENLVPGDYYVSIPATNFEAMESLEAYQLSSTPTNTNDDQMDNDDNGSQDGGAGTVINSPIINLMAGDEPMNEPGQGGDQDAADDDNGDMTIDFGLIPAVSVGSTVFLDANNDGQFDELTEAGISGVTVELYSPGPDGVIGGGDDILIGTTTTDMSGDYFFGGLPEGDYYIQIPTAPGDYPLSSTTTDTMDNSQDNDDNGDQPGGAGTITTSPLFTLEADNETSTEAGQGEEQDDFDDNNGDMTIDFGFTPAVSIGSTVFSDPDNDGMFEPGFGENGIPGVTVELYSTGDDGIPNTADDILVGTTTTDDDGDYFFGGLPEGEYYIQLPASNFSSGQPLEDLTLSSVPTDTNDNGEDNDDNGTQAGGQGTVIQSPEIVLTADTEPVGETGQGGDQDDADDNNGDMTIDFGLVPIQFDLALYKVLAPGQASTVEPNDTVNFVIAVVNQGNVAADNITLTDYVPTNMTFDLSLNPGWVETADGPQYTLSQANSLLDPGGLAIGDTATIAIALTVNAALEAGITITNFAEISAATDAEGVNQPDVDSTPDTNNDDTFLTDNEINGDGLNGGDEDDHDPASVTTETFDLALVKILADDQEMAVEPGDTVHFRIRVINQGTIAADNIQLADYIPSEMTFEGGITGNGDWSESSGIASRTLQVGDELPAGGLAPGADVEVSIYLTVNSPLDPNTTITNFAEIAAATDENGDAQQDVDSTPDSTPGDTFLVDNEVDGNGNDGEDEDDHDPASVVTEAFDLALLKTLSEGQGSTVEPGDTVSFDIVVINQGVIAADNITVVDYIPTNLNFDANLNPDWGLNGGEYTTTLSVADGDLDNGGLLPGERDTVSIKLIVAAPLAAGTTITNFAEIAAATDENGDPQDDIDSTPNTDSDDDTFTEDDYTDGNGNNGGDEDDHDPETITVETFDLALIKLLADDQEANVAAGDTVHFRIRVINQGEIAADNIELSDYLPTEFSFEDGITGNDNWTESTGIVSRTLTIMDGDIPSGGLLPGDSVEVSIYLTLDSPLAPNLTINNFAEITDATDENGDPQVDNDSTPDADDSNDNLITDNEVSGDGNNGEDEDDHDIASVVTDVFDLALIKTLSVGQNSVVEPGDTVSFTIEIINQGEIAADNISIQDYFPLGLIYDGDLNQPFWNSLGNEGEALLSVANNRLPVGGLQPGASTTVDIIFIVDAPLPQGTQLINTAEIAGATDDTGDPQQDIDSTPDTTNDDTFLADNDISGNGNEGEDEDDHDIAILITEGFDLALFKTLSDGQSELVEPGDTVNFTITVVNQGMIAADNIELTDYIPSGMNFDADLNPDWNLNTDGEAQTVLRISDGDLPNSGLAPSATTTVDLILIVYAPLPAESSLVNYAEISSATNENGIIQQDVDSTPDEDNDDVLLTDNEINGNGNFGGDEDDHDLAEVFIETFDLALIKQLSDGQASVVAPADTISFTITVLNQGMIAADNIEITDYIPDGLSFDQALNPDWSLNGDGEAQTTLNIPGGLAPSATTTVDIILVVDAPLPAGITLENIAEISRATDENGDPQEDVDSTPDEDNDDTFLADNEVNGNGLEGEDEDDHDSAVVTIQTFDLALTKVASDVNVEPGDLVTFTIEVFNQGMIAADNIEITDYIPDGLIFNGFLNNGWSLNADLEAQIILSVANGRLPNGGLAPETSVTVDLVLGVAAPLPANTSLVNWAEISEATDENGDPQQDVDSTPDEDNDDTFLTDNDIDADGMNGGDEDDHDPAEVRVLPFDLALRKTLGADQPNMVEPGDTVSFAIEIFNQGMIPADNITVSDYNPEGLNFDADLNPDWILNGDGLPQITLSVANGDLPTGGLLEGESIIVDILLVVSLPPLPINQVEFENIAEISEATDADGIMQDDIDSTPDDENDDLIVGDDDITGNGIAGGDEDDHDPAVITVEIFDLALRKMLAIGQSATIAPGDEVTFVIEVINQGSVIADSIVVTDYIPEGLIFNPSIEPDWIINDEGLVQTILSSSMGTLPNTGLIPGVTVDVPITLLVPLDVEPGQTITNLAEIAFAADPFGTPRDDIDSKANTDPDDDDFEMDDDVNGTDGDEDDSDPVEIELECFANAGVDNRIEVCLGCDEAAVDVDLFGMLGGTPDEGGFWTDLNGTGVDLSDPENVTIPGTLPPGYYYFRYTIPGINGCPDVSARIELQIISIENLICNGNANISLGENCEAQVTADAILQGSFPCFSALQVELFDDQGAELGDIITSDYIGQTLTVRLIDPQCDNHCWGTITVEDKKDPLIECPEPTDEAQLESLVQLYTGSLDIISPTLATNGQPLCFQDQLAGNLGTFSYDVLNFTVAVEDTYFFDLTEDWNGATLALFRGDFNPEAPCETLLAVNDVTIAASGGYYPNGTDLTRLALPLRPGQAYSLLITSIDSDQAGSFELAIYAEGNGFVNGLGITPATFHWPLICTDLGEVLDNPASLAYTGAAIASDNCTAPITDIVFEDLQLASSICTATNIPRTFTATDNSGNTDQCVQEITVRKPSLDDVTLPPYRIILECSDIFETLDSGNPAPSVSGFPFVKTAFGLFQLADEYCNLGASYSDAPRVEDCGENYKFRRIWSLFDWCNPISNFTFQQVIEVKDFTPPMVSCPVFDYNSDGEPDLISFQTNGLNCTSTFLAPLPEVSDNCSGNLSIHTEIITELGLVWYDDNGQANGFAEAGSVVYTIESDNPDRTVNNLSPGCYRFRYLVSDGCGDEATEECIFLIEDTSGPVAVCNDDLHITLDGSGYAKVFAADIDEGSSDNCGTIRVEARREITKDPNSCELITPYYSEWGDYVEFGCCNIPVNETDSVRIELRVWDDRNGDGIAGNTIDVTLCDGNVITISDNYNTCWLDVLVEDKIVPFCTAPDDITINCNDLPFNFDPTDINQLQDYFGMATASDNCEASAEELTPTDLTEDCGDGQILRTFQAVDPTGNISFNNCQQVITIRKEHNYAIQFPQDAEDTCGAVNPDTIQVFELGCDLLAVAVEDERFEASGDECYKIFRIYSVINWCEYDGVSDPLVVGRDEDLDNNPGDEAVWVLRRPTQSYIDQDDTESNGVIRTVTSNGYWQYTQHIRVYDDVAPSIQFETPEPFCSIDNSNCDGPVSYSFTIDEACTPTDLTITLTLDAFADGTPEGDISSQLLGDYPNYRIEGTFPIGNHQFLVTVRDGCGNETDATLAFEVIDCKAPTPICINGLATELMPLETPADVDGDGIEDVAASTIWASDYIASPVTDCSTPVTYAIYKDADFLADSTLVPDPAQTSLTLTCQDIGSVTIRIYAFDSAGNFDYCETYVLVQDNLGWCPGDGAEGSIAGMIQTSISEPVAEVEVNLSGNGNFMEMTGDDGAYAFYDLAEGYDYSVVPYKNDDLLNGVTTFDIVLISKHILAIESLETPYQRIAADVNRSNTISSLDIIHMRKAILFIADEFPNNTSWRFVEANHEFSNQEEPWNDEFAELTSINDFDGEATLANFTAIKVGDVNNSALTNAMMTEERNIAGTFYLNIEEQAFKTGEEVVVAINSNQLAAIQGYQMTFQFNNKALELTDIHYGILQEQHIGTPFIDEGYVTISWHGESLEENATLVELVFKGKEAGTLSDHLAISSKYTRAEAYNQSGELLQIGLDFGAGTKITQGYELYQNIPNPFDIQTVIAFYLPVETKATLRIQDAAGRILFQLTDQYAPGYQQLIINQDQLNSAGVLYYTLETDGFTETKKMILLR